jgi:hypothetical protein
MAPHFVTGLLSSSAVNVKLHVGPVSRRILSAIRRFVAEQPEDRAQSGAAA